MDIGKFLKKIKMGQIQAVAPEQKADVVPPQSPPAPAPIQPPAQQTAQPSALSPTTPGDNRRIYPTEFKIWRKPKGWSGGKKVWQVMGYYLNVFEVDPNSTEGKALASAGYKYSKDSFSKPVKAQGDIEVFAQELESIQQAANCIFDKKWMEGAKEIFPGTDIISDIPVETGTPSGEESEVEQSPVSEQIRRKVEDVFSSRDLDPTRKKEITDEYIKVKLKQLAEMSEEAQQTVLKEMLAIHDGFHNYSLVNRILMLLQRPNVSEFVAGKGSWENPNGILKRQVKEGEEPLNIFAPEQYNIWISKASKIFEAIKGYRQTVGKDGKISDPDYLAKQIGMDDWGTKHYLGYVFMVGGNTLDKIIGFIEGQLNDKMFQRYKNIYYGKKKNAFKIVPVYDINQTEPTGPDSFNLDEHEEKWMGSNAPDDVAQALTLGAVEYAKTARYRVGSEWKTGINVNLAAQLGAEGGWSSGVEVAIRDMSKGWRQFGTVVHEIAHSLLHWGPDRPKFSHRQKEIEAESTTYIVLDYFGYQDLRFAANYLALHKFTEQDVLDRYNQVHFAASSIIEGIKRFSEGKKNAGSWFNKVKFASIRISKIGPIWVSL